MFGQIMFTQWRWTRLIVASMTVFAFMAPSIAWWVGAERVVYPTKPAAVMAGFESTGPMIAVLAMLGAFLLAAYPWTMDAASKHVLPLSLPIPWRRYVSLRYAAGALLLIPSAVALWLGSLFILSIVELPQTLRAYPGALALRFFAASLLMYSLVFALQYVAGKRSPVVALSLVVGVALLGFGLEAIGSGEINRRLTMWLAEFPGPFAVFVTEWKLIDV
jgi:hypothetical protein